MSDPTQQPKDYAPADEGEPLSCMEWITIAAITVAAVTIAAVFFLILCFLANG